MAYNVAANMQFAKPVSAFLDARDNVTRNALAERQVANVEQNTAFNQQRQTAVDKLTADKLAREQDVQDATYMHNALSYLTRVKENPQAYDAVSKKLQADPVFQKHGGLDPAAMTPENIVAEMAQLAAKAGIAPPSRFEEVKGPRGSIIRKNIDTGEMTQVVGPDNTETPNYGAGAMPSLQIITRPVGGGMVQDFNYNPKTGQRMPTGEPYKPVTTMTGNVTEGERKAAALATRLDASLQKLQAVTSSNEASQKPGLLERGFENIGMETAANMARSPARQRVNAAQLDALDAALTLATGAAYTKEQLESLRTSYFPQMGDDESTVKDKRDRFALIVETARIAAGRAEPSVDKALATRPDAQQPAPAGNDLAAAAAAELARRRGQRGP